MPSPVLPSSSTRLIVLGPCVGVMTYMLAAGLPLDVAGQRVIGVAAWMVTWWVSEAVPLPVTALLPLALFPVADIAPMRDAAVPYSHPLVFLFFGGFLLGLALEKWALHERLALALLARTGTDGPRLLLGFMLATGFLSMWISNVAATVIMLPIAQSVIALRSEERNGTDTRLRAVGLVLGIAYAANIGGTATLIGTPPNAVAAGYLADAYEVDLSFVQWMGVGVPFAAVMIAVAYLLLAHVVFRGVFTAASASERAQSEVLLQTRRARLGALSREESAVLGVFSVTLLLWVVRPQVSAWVPLSDTGIVILAALALFLLPARDGGRLLAWGDTQRLPWGVLLLFGGGLSLAAAFLDTGVVDLVGGALADSAGTWSTIMLLGVCIVVMLGSTELMSNLALVTVFLPIVAGVAVALGEAPIDFAVPVTLAASCAFMLPMATPANAVVFGTGHLRVWDMVRAGVLINLAAILVLLVLVRVLVPFVFR